MHEHLQPEQEADNFHHQVECEKVSCIRGGWIFSKYCFSCSSNIELLSDENSFAGKSCTRLVFSVAPTGDCSIEDKLLIIEGSKFANEPCSSYYISFFLFSTNPCVQHNNIKLISTMKWSFMNRTSVEIIFVLLGFIMAFRRTNIS